MTQPASQMELLSTRLRPPPYRERLVARTRLLERLDGALEHPLTLVCAPAGYGKTTLLSQWTARCQMQCGWLSLDRSDNDLTQFLRYLLAALQGIDPGVGALIPGMLQPPRPQTGPALWIALINDLAASGREFLLVLDDYQEVLEPAVHAGLEYLVEHMPANLHLVLATRADPPLNLAQLRARGQLLELRAADLCFNHQDAGLFFQEVMALPLSEDEIAALVQKAEGWAAGLQIAAIVLQNQPDLSQAVQAFTGSHRHILDYLAAEVIERLPGTTQEFLSQTAILDLLEPSLCDAVTGRSDSRQILERLDRENQFIVRLDGERRWYRYHRLMAEALRLRTESLEPGLLARLHGRASVWYEASGMVEAAIGHALEAGDPERAARLIETGAEAILKRSQVATLLGWLERLPEEQLRRHPRLNLAYAWALLLKSGSLQAARARMELAASQTAGELPSGELAVIRALLATMTGDINLSLAQARQALAELPAGQTYLRSIAASNLGMAQVVLGDSQSAIQAFQDSIALAQAAGNTMFAVASMSNLGGLYLVQGQLHWAEAVFRRALELATTPYGQRLPVACRAMLGLAEISREWDDLEQASQMLEQAIQLARQYNETSELVLLLNLARVRQIEGHADQALGLVQRAGELAIQSTTTQIDDRLVEAALAHLWLQQGQVFAAAEWAARRGFDQADSGGNLPGDNAAVPYDLRVAEWLVYARLLLVQDQAQAALDTLAALLDQAHQQGRLRRWHEALVLMALAWQALGSTDEAINLLAKSLELAEPQGYVRLYIDDSPAMASLLREAARRGIQPDYCQRLLGAFQAPVRAPGDAQAAGMASLLEPLSQRELEVLQLLAEGCTNREIGERLYISLSTVKGHVSNLSGKLSARNRTEAVASARRLGLLRGD